MGSGIRPKKDFSRHQKDMVRAGLQQSLNPDTQSPESTISEAPTQGLLASASKDTNTQNIQTHRVGRPTGKDVPIVSDESMANKVSTPEPEQVIGKISGANTQNLKGCGKCKSNNLEVNGIFYTCLDCGNIDDSTFSQIAEKCQGKVK